MSISGTYRRRVAFGVCAAAMTAMSLGAWSAARGGPADAARAQAAAPLPADASLCGPWSRQGSTTAAAIVSARGTIRNCQKVGTDWVIATTSGSASAGSLGILACGGDKACQDGRGNPGRFARWHWFQPSGLAGGATILGVNGTTLIVDVSGQELTFSLASDEFAAAAG